MTFDPKSPATPTPVPLSDFNLTGVACPATNSCIAVDEYRNAVEGNPAVGGSWTVVPTRSTGSLRSVSCSSSSQCVAVDSAGDAFVGPASVTTGSHAGATGFGKGHAKLSFTLTAAANAAAIRTIKVALPGGLGFRSSNKSLVEGIVVEARRKKLKLTAKVSRGKLTITLTVPAAAVQITISRPALTVTKTLADKVKAGKLKTLQISLKATNTSRKTTRITLDSGAK